MKNLNTYEVTFVTFDFPEDPNAYHDLDDFDYHRSTFQGENIVDALLNGLEAFGKALSNYWDYSCYWTDGEYVVGTSTGWDSKK